MSSIKLGLSQINTRVGGFEHNRELIKRDVSKASKFGVDIVVFPELALCGYPPQDLSFEPGFLEQNLSELDLLAKEFKNEKLLVGFVEKTTPDNVGRTAHNSVALLDGGKISGVWRKTLLPNYGVFDEKRTFLEPPPNTQKLLNLHIRGKNAKIGVSICEDLWDDSGPYKEQIENGAQLLINVSASPFSVGKQKKRLSRVQKLAKENGVAIAVVNLVGGQDELVFDGGSFAFNRFGEMLVMCKRFDEDFLVVDIDLSLGKEKTLKSNGETKTLSELNDESKETYEALVLGTHDFIKKCGYKKVCVAVSGGIDSALVATIACDALGSKNVLGVYLPSRYSSNESEIYTRDLCKKLGMDLKIASIEDSYTALKNLFFMVMGAEAKGLVSENIQPRVRASLMMAVANKTNSLLLATGNKSEMAMGYTTLYGDTCGSLAPIKDLTKTMVWRLAKWRNLKKDSPIPQKIVGRKPTAELRPNQLDEDSLPAYEKLDELLSDYLKENKSKTLSKKVKDSFGVEGMLFKSEFKRFQSPPGLKITDYSFGRDRRMPIASSWPS